MSKYAPHHRTTNNPRATSSTVCQKCLGTGHFTYQCKSTRPYVTRPSRTQQLENPRVIAKLKAEGKPSVEVPDEFKNKSGTADRILEAKEKAREKDDGKRVKKRAKRSNASSSSGSDGSSSDSSSNSDSESSSSGSESSGSGSLRSRERNQKRRVPRRRRTSSISGEDDEDKGPGSSSRR